MNVIRHYDGGIKPKRSQVVVKTASQRDIARDWR